MCLKYGWGAGGHPEPRRLVGIRVLAPRYRRPAARHLRHRWELAGSEERQGKSCFDALPMTFRIFLILQRVPPIIILFPALTITVVYRPVRVQTFLMQLSFCSFQTCPVWFCTFGSALRRYVDGWRCAVSKEQPLQTRNKRDGRKSCERNGLKITPGVYRPVLLSRAPSIAPSVSSSTSDYFLFSRIATHVPVPSYVYTAVLTQRYGAGCWLAGWDRFNGHIPACRLVPLLVVRFLFLFGSLFFFFCFLGNLPPSRSHQTKNSTQVQSFFLFSSSVSFLNDLPHWVVIFQRSHVYMRSNVSVSP